MPASGPVATRRHMRPRLATHAQARGSGAGGEQTETDYDGRHPGGLSSGQVWKHSQPLVMAGELMHARDGSNGFAPSETGFGSILEPLRMIQIPRLRRVVICACRGPMERW